MEIYFVRHANAGQHKLNPEADDKRPLDKDGIEQSHSVGRGLAAHGVAPAVVISSPLLRAFQTAEIVAKEIGHKHEIVINSALRPEASYEQFLKMLAKYRSSGGIMVVGHDPSLSDFLNKILSSADSSFLAIELKKGAVAKVEQEGRGHAILKWLVTPKLVRSLQKASASSSRPKTTRK